MSDISRSALALERGWEREGGFYACLTQKLTSSNQRALND